MTRHRILLNCVPAQAVRHGIAVTGLDQRQVTDPVRRAVLKVAGRRIVRADYTLLRDQP
jgi:hypothetical protein